MEEQIMIGLEGNKKHILMLSNIGLIDKK